MSAQHTPGVAVVNVLRVALDRMIGRYRETGLHDHEVEAARVWVTAAAESHHQSREPNMSTRMPRLPSHFVLNEATGKLSDQPLTGPWKAVNQSVGCGYAPKRPWTVQKPGQWFATAGRVHRYGSEAAAQKAADTLNIGESTKERRAAIAKATGSTP